MTSHKCQHNFTFNYN